MSEKEIMTHLEAHALLADYVADELDNQQYALVEAHIDQCDDCQQALTEVQRIRYLLRVFAAPAPSAERANTNPPFSLADAVIARLDEPAALIPFDLALLEADDASSVETADDAYLLASIDNDTVVENTLPRSSNGYHGILSSLLAQQLTVEGQATARKDVPQDPQEQGASQATNQEVEWHHAFTEEQGASVAAEQEAERKEDPAEEQTAGQFGEPLAARKGRILTRLPAVLEPRHRQRALPQLLLLAAALLLICLSGALFFAYSGHLILPPGQHPNGHDSEMTPTVSATAKPTRIPNVTVIPVTPLPGGSSATSGSAVVNIIPDSQELQNTFTVPAVTGTPDPSQRQVQARWVTMATSSQSSTVNATGAGTTPGTYSTGTVRVINGGPPLHMPVNTVLTSQPGEFIKRSVNVVLLQAVDLPAGSDSNQPGMSVQVRAQQVGSNNNLAVNDFWAHTIAENLPVAWNARNTTAFTGGTDPQNYTFVQQSDIDGAAKALEANVPNPQQALQGQVRSNERLIGSPTCQPTMTANHAANDKAANVTVSVSFTCRELAYDYNGALAMGAQMLKEQAIASTGSGYVQAGDVSATFSSAQVTDAAQGVVGVAVSAQGIWVYQPDDAQKQTIARMIAGKTRAEALAVFAGIKGIKRASIQLTDGMDTLPVDSSLINIVVQPTGG